jgi:hypothetical protein
MTTQAAGIQQLASSLATVTEVTVTAAAAAAAATSLLASGARQAVAALVEW